MASFLRHINFLSKSGARIGFDHVVITLRESPYRPDEAMMFVSSKLKDTSVQ